MTDHGVAYNTRRIPSHNLVHKDDCKGDHQRHGLFLGGDGTSLSIVEGANSICL